MSAGRQRVGRALVKAQPWLLRNGDRVWRPLRRFRPVLRIGKAVVLTRHEDVRQVLERDDVFSVTYGAHMEEVTGPFILGMDDGPQYRAESGALHAAVERGDLDRIAELTRARAREVLDGGGDAPLDAVALADEAVGACLDAYFGLPAISGAEDRERARDVFRAVFLDGDTPAVMDVGRAGAARIVGEIEREIARLRASADPLPDTVLGRLLAAGELADADIPRNLLGLIAAWTASVPRAFALGLDVLLDREDLDRAADAARRGAEDEVATLLVEALRLQPQAPFLTRKARGPMVVAPGAAREEHVRPGDVVIAVTMSAMRDRHVLDQPDALVLDRPASDVLHFGAGIHRCFGAAISETQFGALGTALLAAGDIQRAGPLRWGEAFPAGLPLRRR